MAIAWRVGTTILLWLASITGLVIAVHQGDPLAWAFGIMFVIWTALTVLIVRAFVWPHVRAFFAIWRAMRGLRG